jgi:multiple sugar transport system permease protein
MTTSTRDLGWRWLSVGPTVAILLALTLVPIVLILVMSVHDIHWEEGKAVWKQVGFANYGELRTNPFYTAALKNTYVFVVAAVVIEMLLGFGLALLVSRLTRGRTIYLAIFLLPILIPAIVIGAIWKLMYNYDFGLFNELISLIGLSRQDWLGDSNLALASVVLVDVWHWTSFCFLLLLAGLESLPQDVSEAAKLDGASFLQEFRHITLPLMWPVILVALVTRTLLAFKVFDEVFLLTQGGPGTATEVLSFTVFRVFFDEDREGFGSAMSISIIIMVIALLLIGALITRRRTARP